MNNLPNIYIFTDWYVPGYRAGGPIQSVFNLATLLSKHFNVKIITTNRDYGSLETYGDVLTDQWHTLAPQHEVLYLSLSNIKFKTIKELCKNGKNDIIFINGLFSFYFSVLPLFFANYYNVKKILVAPRGMLHRSALSIKPFRKQVFLSFARGFGLYKKAIMLSTSIFEDEEIRKTLGKVIIKLGPNIPITPLHAIPDKIFKSPAGELRLLFLGRISPEKNPIVLLKALQEITFPTQVKFVGSGITESYTQQFESLFNSLPSHIHKEWIKELPHAETLALQGETDLMVLPSLGENFGHAIFESLAHATPVIIGNNTPWKGIEEKKAGIEVEPQNELLLKQAIERFYGINKVEYNTWQWGALQTAREYFESNNFESVYREVLG